MHRAVRHGSGDPSTRGCYLCLLTVSRRCLHVKAEFDDKRSDAQQAGRQPDPRLGQIERLETEAIDLHTRLNRRNAQPAELQEFQTTARSRLTAQRRDHRPTTRRTRHLGNRKRPQVPSPIGGRMSGELPSGGCVALCGLPDDGGSAPQQFASIVSTVRNHETRDTNVPSHRQLGERSRLSPRQNGAGRVSCRDIWRSPAASVE